MISACITASIERICGIVSCSASRQNKISSVSAKRMNGITASASILCDIGKLNGIRVIPTEIQWVDVSLSAEYNIITKNDWYLE